MVLQRYTGATPSNVNKDAKYTVRSNMERGGSDRDVIRLIHHINSSDKYLLTTHRHPGLVDMVNKVKMELNHQERGVFYINEFHHVLVPGQTEGIYYAGTYPDDLEFELEAGKILSPGAPPHLRAGDPWTGPRVGIKYALAASGADIYYEVAVTGTLTRTVRLSEHVGRERATETARRLARYIGRSGGRFYINERSELFAPATAYRDSIYLGHLGESAWFDVPEGFGQE